MSQMPQLSACPSCEWPLESGDRFCGACGYDLSAVPVRPDDHPTIALNGSAPPPVPGGPDPGAGAAQCVAAPELPYLLQLFVHQLLVPAEAVG
ncbi:zinc ribbon domain-containing protein, partial [Streptomyces chartreusis]